MIMKVHLIKNGFMIKNHFRSKCGLMKHFTHESSFSHDRNKVDCKNCLR